MANQRCRMCRTKYRPIRWRAMFDAWLCPRCESYRVRDIVDGLIKELSTHG